MRTRNVIDLGTAAAIASLAFGKTRMMAVLVWPIMFFGMVGSWPFGRVYLSPDRNGTVTIRRRGWRGTIGGVLWALMVYAAAAIVTLGAVLAGRIGLVLLQVIAAIALLIVVWIFVGAGVLISRAGGDRQVAFREVGPETPRGRRYSVSALAQRPGTSFSALHAAHAALAELPAGSVAVACAANQRLQRAYVEHGGFSAGDGLRVYKVIDAV